MPVITKLYFPTVIYRPRPDIKFYNTDTGVKCNFIYLN